MASQVFPIIQKQIELAVDNTDLNLVYIGWKNFSQNQMPAARVMTTGGFPKLINNGEYHICYKQAWAVVTQHPDQGQEIVEKLMWLWLQDTERATLNALGLIGLTMKITDTPMVFPINTSGYESYVDFEFRVQVTDPF